MTSTAKASDDSRSKAVKGAISYTVSGLIGRSIGFLLLPLFTRELSPGEYGDLSVMVAVIAFSSIAFGLGLDSAVVRTWFTSGDNRDERLAAARSVIAAAAMTALVGASAAIATVLLLDSTLFPSLDGGLLSLAFMSAAVSTCGNTIPMAVLRAQERPGAYAAVALSGAIATAAVSTFLVLVLHDGVPGVLWGGLAGYLVSAVIAAVMLPIVPFTKARGAARSALRIGVPLVPHLASMQSLLLADRLLLTALVGEATIGVYGLASNMALPAIIACQAVTQATMPTFARVGTGESPPSELRSMISRQAAAATSVCLVCALCGPPLITIVTPASYHGATDLVGWIVLGYLFVGWYGIPMNGATIGAGRTSRAWLATFAGAIVNLTLVATLTPAIGIEGAAIASAAGYFVLLIGIALWSSLGENVAEYDWRRLARITALGSGAYAVIATATPDAGLASLAIRGALVTVVGGLMVRAAGRPGRTRAVA